MKLVVHSGLLAAQPQKPLGGRRKCGYPAGVGVEGRASRDGSWDLSEQRLWGGMVLGGKRAKDLGVDRDSLDSIGTATIFPSPG